MGCSLHIDRHLQHGPPLPGMPHVLTEESVDFRGGGRGWMGHCDCMCLDSHSHTLAPVATVARLDPVWYSQIWVAREYSDDGSSRWQP